jgi:hypothetical protein
MRLKVTNTFECDEKIADMIIKLYRKGYITEFCCSGHPNDMNPYIAFDKNTSIELSGSHPVNWIADCGEYDGHKYTCYAIRRKFTIKEKIMNKPDNLIDKAMIELESWVDSLPKSKFNGLYNEIIIEKISE